MEEVFPFLLSWLPAFAKASGFVVMWRGARNHLRAGGTLAASAALSIWLWSSAGPSDWLKIPLLQAFASGAVCALPFALLLESLPALGQLLDLFRGAQAAEQLIGAERVSAGEGLFELALLHLFFSAGAYQRPLTVLFQSAEVPLAGPEQAALILSGVFLFACPAATLSIIADLIFGGAARMSRVSAVSELANLKLFTLQFVLFLFLFYPPEAVTALLRGI